MAPASTTRTSIDRRCGGNGARGATAATAPSRARAGALSGRHRRALFQSTVAQATHDRAIAFDDTSKDFLDNVELKKVLAEVKRQTGRELDVLGFDACLMSMVEIAYQLRGTARSSSDPKSWSLATAGRTTAY